MRNNKHGDKWTLKLRLFVSFYCILLLPVVLLGVFALRWATTTIHSNTVSSYAVTMENVGEGLYEYIASMDDMVSVFAKDSNIYRISYMRGDSIDYSRISLSALHEYKNQLILHCMNNPFWDDVIICFPQKNSILSTMGIWKMDWFFQDEFYVHNMDREAIQDILPKKTVMSNLQVTSYGKAKQGTAFFLPGITSPSGVPLMCAIFWVDNTTLDNQLKNLALYPGTVVSLYDNGDHLIHTYSNEGIDGLQAIETDDEQYEQLTWVSKKSGWHLAVSVPQHALYGEAGQVTQLMVILLVIVAVIGYIICWELAALNYRPLERLLRTVGTYFKTNVPSTQGNMHMIEEQLLELLKEKDALWESTHNNRELLQYAVLSHLLKGDEPYQALTHRTSLSMLGIDLPHPWYRVFMAINMNSEEQFSLACEESPCRCYVLHQGNHGVVVVNYAAEEDLEALLHTLASMCQVLCISQVQNHPSGIATAYQQALDVKAYRLLSGDASIFFPEDVQPNRTIEYSAQAERLLLCELRGGNKSTAQGLVEQLMKKNDTPATQAKLIDALEISLLKTDDGQGTLAARMRALSAFAPQDEQARKVYANKLIEIACAYYATTKARAKTALAQEISLYIDENIRDEQLSLTTTAAHLGLTGAYLSRYFRDNFGIGYLDYVNKKRVLLAKELILTSQVTVREAALAVGVGNDATLRRLFKKYEGVVPSALASLSKETI